MPTVNITVRQQMGTYLTSRLLRQSASCTAGPKQAAEALGHKAFGTRFDRAEEFKASPAQHGVTHWRLHFQDPESTRS